MFDMENGSACIARPARVCIIHVYIIACFSMTEHCWRQQFAPGALLAIQIDTGTLSQSSTTENTYIRANRLHATVLLQSLANPQNINC